MTPDTIRRLRERYFTLVGEEPANAGAIPTIEKRLNLTLPDDIKAISEFYSGGFLGGISHYAIAVGGPADNVLDETIRLRVSIAFPDRLLVLAEPPESIIVLNCKSETAHEPAVIWCDALDSTRLDEFTALTKPETWSSYSSFFAHLLDEEEKEQASKRQHN
jgi:hypothetical protein